MRHGAFRGAVSALATIVVVLALAVPSSSAAPARALTWQLLDTGSASHFRGLAAVSKKVAWVSGYEGVVLRTTDGGRSWSDVSVPGAGSLQFRDITAFDARRAVVMAAGTGTDSRLYATSDGGATWQLTYENTDPAAFFDCMAFFDPRHGLVLSDPVDGKFRILRTSDGGAHWTVQSPDGMPPAGANEFGFAASGECLTTRGHDAWFGSGGPDGSRVFHSRDGGRTWGVDTTPVVRGASAGIFGIAFANPHRGIAVGGDFAAPTADTDVAAETHSANSWSLAAQQPHGYRSGVTFVRGATGMALAVGLTGSDVSYDSGHHWTQFDTGQFDTVACTRGGACWASGDLGRVAALGH
jgi:photosystem II stability/assembly factor-like uncharacterized protein